MPGGIPGIPGEDFPKEMEINEGGPSGGSGFVNLGGGGGITPPFLQPFLSGLAPGFAGFGPTPGFSPRRLLPQNPFQQGGQVQRRGGAAPFAMATTQGAGGGSSLQGFPGFKLGAQGFQPGYQPAGSGGPFGEGPFGPVGTILQNAYLSGQFGNAPPEALMAAVRQRAIADAGAQERAARLGLQGRTDIDPSTFGVQSLLSQLQGQQGVSQALGNADLQLRQQQLQNQWDLLSRLLGAHSGQTIAEIGAHGGNQGFDWGGLAQGAGSLVGGIRGK